MICDAAGCYRDVPSSGEVDPVVYIVLILILLTVWVVGSYGRR